MSSITIIPSSEIDYHQWDVCIAQSKNPMVYATSTWLQQMADSWHGLVLNNYEAVMPVVWRKKFGIRYCYTMPFTQQLGIYAKHPQPRIEEEFIQALVQFVQFGDYAFNYGKTTAERAANVHHNYILPLQPAYEIISAAYSKDVHQNIKKAAKEALQYAPASYTSAIQIFQELYQHKTPHVTLADYDSFRLLCHTLDGANQLISRQVLNAKNEVLAIVLLIQYQNRIYNIMNSTTTAGRNSSANYWLLDNVFKEFAASNYVFDFEGSDIPGIQSFYEKFGAVNQPYSSIHINRLPFPLNLLKR